MSRIQWMAIVAFLAMGVLFCIWWAVRRSWYFSGTGYEIGVRTPFRYLDSGIVFRADPELVDWEDLVYGAKGPDGRIYDVVERRDDFDHSHWTINRAKRRKAKCVDVAVTVVGMADDYPPPP